MALATNRTIKEFYRAYRCRICGRVYFCRPECESCNKNPLCPECERKLRYLENPR